MSDMGKKRDEDCIFCKIAYSDNVKLPEYDQKIITTGDFFVIPALGQFTEGYVLIFPKAHFLNLGTMNSTLFKRFLAVKEQVSNLLFEEYGFKPVFFEHGPGCAGSRGGSCVDHAHLHALPNKKNLTSPPSRVSEHLDGGRIDDMRTVIEYAKTGKSYFFLEYPGTMFLYDALPIPCQYGRQIFARELGVIDKWDWRRYPYFKETIETGRRLRDRLKTR
jgi:ATP adenylyltransferase